MDEKNFGPFADFPASAENALHFLKQRLELDAWLVARKEGDAWIALRGTPNAYRIEEGDKLSWAHSLCCSTIEASGPDVVPDISDDSPWQRMGARSGPKVKSYAGAPILRRDGSMFGVLCGIDPEPQPKELMEETDLLTTMGRFLSTILAADMRAMEDALRLERMRVESLTDPVTGLGNRRYWMHLLAAEESRCRRYGEPATIVMLDVDPRKSANGDVLSLAGNALRMTSRVHDVVARIGGSTLAMLAVNCDRKGAQILTGRLKRTLRSEGVKASIGVGFRTSKQGLELAWQSADAHLRASKVKKA